MIVCKYTNYHYKKLDADNRQIQFFIMIIRIVNIKIYMWNKKNIGLDYIKLNEYFY